MGLSGKPQVDESEGKRWRIAGIPLRAPLKKLHTTAKDNGDDDTAVTTPKNEESRIPPMLTCPPAPRKRKSSSKCNYSGVRDYFSPPDLDVVFIRHVERANC